MFASSPNIFALFGLIEMSSMSVYLKGSAAPVELRGMLIGTLTVTTATATTHGDDPKFASELRALICVTVWPPTPRTPACRSQC